LASQSFHWHAIPAAVELSATGFANVATEESISFPDHNPVAYTAEDVSFNIEIVVFDAEAGRLLGQLQSLATGQNLDFL
jgi:hypothetical protein